MNPFRVQCETCQAVLKVRDESAFGQIHACPKCGGMVHLVPSAALGKDKLDAPRSPTPPGEGIGTPVLPSDVPSVLADPEMADDLGLDSTPPSGEELSATEERLIDVPPDRFGGYLVPLVASAGTTLLLAGALAHYLLRTGDTVTKKNAPEPTKIAEAPAIPVPSEEAIKPQMTPSPVDLVTEEKSPSPILDPLPAPVEPTGETPAETVPPASSEPADSGPRAATQTPSAVDPLDLDPAAMDLVLLRSPGERKQPQESSDPTPRPTDRQQIGPEVQADAQIASLDRRLADRAVFERIWVERGASEPLSLTPERLAQRLGERTPEIHVARAPLHRALSLWSEWSGVPVTLPPEALAHAAVSPKVEVSLQGVDQSMAEVLLAALKPVRLGYANRRGALVLLRPGAERAREASYPVADLIEADEADASGVAELVGRFVPSIDSENLEVEQDRLSLSGPTLSHYDLAVFCERLRKARRLKSQSRYPNALLRVEPPLATLTPTLNRNTTFSFVGRTTLPEVFDHWRRVTGLVILIDWAALADQDLDPSSTLRCSATDRPWREAFDGVLGALGIGWRPIDGQTIQITTLGVVAEANLVEFYPVQSQDANHQRQELLDAIPSDGETAIVFDSPSRSLLVRGSAATHRAVMARIDDRQE